MQQKALLAHYVTESFPQEVAFLQRLVCARSTNPYTPDTSPVDAQVEAQVASVILHEMNQLGFDSPLHGTSSQRQNILCTLSGSQKGQKALILATHMDTVEASEEYTYDPWGATIEENRLYGVGAADAKAQIAAFLYATHAIKQAGVRLAGDFHLAFVVDEEAGASSPYGTRYLLEQGLLHGDAALIGEPGNHKIAIGHRGLYRFKIKTFGVSFHTGTKEWEERAPGQGQNAILAMSGIALALTQCELPHHQSIAFPGRHNVLTFPTLIQGGKGINMVPESCEAYGEVWLVLGTSIQEVKARIEHVLTQLAFPYQLDDIVAIPAVETSPETEIVQVLAQAVEQSTGHFPRLEGCGPACDGWMFSVRGIPTICGYGVECGNVHGANEWVSLESLQTTTEIYARAIVSYLKQIENIS